MKVGQKHGLWQWHELRPKAKLMAHSKACGLALSIRLIAWIGSPAWSSPERLMSKKVGPPNDVFAFAVVACCMWINNVPSVTVSWGAVAGCTVTVPSLLYYHHICLWHVYVNVCTQTWECLTTLRPWAECSDVLQIIAAVLTMNRRLKMPSSVPAAMTALPALICDCWQVGLCPII